MTTANTVLDRWHHIVFNRDLSALSDLLADDVVFKSPVFWSPKAGKAAAYLILSTVIDVFEDFTYHRELVQGDTLCLEFSARVGDFGLKGIDLIQFNDAGQIIDFEVFVRPMNGLQALGAAMQARLVAGS